LKIEEIFNNRVINKILIENLIGLIGDLWKSAHCIAGLE
jgi:hypothetical protein